MWWKVGGWSITNPGRCRFHLSLVKLLVVLYQVPPRQYCRQWSPAQRLNGRQVMNVVISGWEGGVLRFRVDGKRDGQQPRQPSARTDRQTADDLPMGMTTPNTATVRFSPRRKCSLPAEVRERERSRGVRLEHSVREDE